MADGHRLTIFHDDRSWRDRRERLLDDMRRQVDEDLRRFGFGRQHWSSDFGSGGSLLGGGGSSWARGGGASDWKTADPIGRLMSHDFFRLRPSSPGSSGSGSLTASRSGEFGSHESLDDATVRGLITDTGGAGPLSAVASPASPSATAAKGGLVPVAAAAGGPRLFSMSFDVKDYDAEDISVTVEEQTLIVSAKHHLERDGAVSVKEFNRKIKIPDEVDPEKLSSTLSSDGILTVEAPVPPVYPTSANSAFMPYQAVQQQEQQQQQLVSNMSQNGNVPSSMRSPPPASVGAGASSPPPPPAAAAAASAATTTTVPLDTPVFSWDESAGRRKMHLLLDVGAPYTADDVVVKLDGRRLIIEATHVDRFHGRSSKTSMQRDFDLPEDIDITSIRALLQETGQLAVSAYVK